MTNPKQDWQEEFEEHFPKNGFGDSRDNWLVRRGTFRAFISQLLISNNQKIAEENYRKGEKEGRRREAEKWKYLNKRLAEKVDNVIGEYLRDFANRPLDKRKNPFDEIVDLREKINTSIIEKE